MQTTSPAEREITEYNSRNAICSEIVRTETFAVAIMRFGRDALLGNHPAGWNQRFTVVEGEGWVRGGGSDVRQVKTGDSVYWASGEMHESGSDEGMVVVIIQSSESLAAG